VGLFVTGIPIFAAALLGLVPILTTARLAKRAGTVLRSTRWSIGQLTVGVAAIVLPTGLVLFVEVLGDEHRKSDFLSGKRDRVVRSLANDSWYGPRDIIQRPDNLAPHICPNLSSLPLHDPEVESAARKALHVPPNQTVREYCFSGGSR
jgi:hypothetical protein